MLAKHRVAFSIIITLLILIVGAVAIFWARGFKFNLKKGTIERTGMLVASSVPNGAEIYLDGRLTSATDTNIAYLEPKTYHVKVQKDGYSTWEKDLEIKADLATEIKVLLFPLAPEIKPLTTIGAVNPTLSPDGTKIIYATSGQRGGVYIMPLSDRPFQFGATSHLIAKNQASFDFTKSKFIWGSDSKQVITQFQAQENQISANLLLDTEKSDQELRDITGSLTATLKSWQDELDTRAQTLALTVPDNVKNATAEAKPISSPQPTVKSSNITAKSEPTTVNQLNYFPTGLIFSPDEEKILFQNKEGKYHVYDLKAKKEFTLPDFADFISLSWYPDSNHLVVAQKDLISIIEADGTNKMNIFSGKFENGFVFAHPAATRLIILTALTQPDGTFPNLYAINLK